MRKTARERLFQLVFEYLFSKEKNDLTIKIVSKQENIDSTDTDYIKTCYDGITAGFDDLVAVITPLSEGFSISRVYKADLAILLVAVYEIINCPDIPQSVSCNEAVELCKKFSTDKSPSFVNGILASVVRQYKRDMPDREE